MRRFSCLFALSVMACLLALSASAANDKDKKKPSSGSAPDEQLSAKAFKAMLVVLRHPRCMNCHSAGDFPRQGDDGHPHTMLVRRGPGGHGVTSQKCQTCHQDHNLPGNDMPPGAPNWHLPPPAMPMVWQGLSDAQLCQSLKDPLKNRNRTVARIVTHMTEDKLVLWAWAPGDGRAPVPMGQAEFAANVHAWADNGAACPK